MNKYSVLLMTLILVIGCTKTETTDTVTPSDTPTNTKETGVFATDMLNAVNALRAKGCTCGNQAMPPVPTLKWNKLLETAAIRHAIDMTKTKTLSHTGSDGSTMQKRIDDTGYRWSYIGENIAWGYLSLSAVMTGWTNSEGHCKNMMSANITEMGAAHNGDNWVQDFGKPLN